MNDKKLKIAVTLGACETRDNFIPPDVAKQIEAMGTVIWNPLVGNYNAEELRTALKDADVCFIGWGCRQLDEYILKDAKNLKIIASTTGSVSSIVSDFLYEKGIKVISGNKLYAESVAEGVIGYIIASLRAIPFYSQDVQSGGWANVDAFAEGLLDQTVGLVGFGAVAKYLTGMLKVFRNKIRIYDPFVSEEVCTQYGVERMNTLEELVSSSKIISLHAARTPETHHLINKKLISMIPDGAVFINTSRGEVVDEEALAEELQKGRFKAVLDVFNVEPLPKKSKLRGLNNVILMPHMGGPTVDRRKMVTLALIEDIKRLYNGEKLQHEISREYAMAMTR